MAEPLSATPLEQVERAKRAAKAFGVNESLINTSDHARWQLDAINATGAELAAAQAALDKIGHKRK